MLAIPLWITSAGLFREALLLILSCISQGGAFLTYGIGWPHTAIAVRDYTHMEFSELNIASKVDIVTLNQSE